MTFQKLDLKKLSDTLTEQCPFIMFAMLNGLDANGQPEWHNNPELSVFISADTGTWHALEQILPVLKATVPDMFVDVTLLNRVDAVTRFRAIQGICLYVREDSGHNYRRFVQQAFLDYRIMRARGRSMGFIDND